MAGFVRGPIIAEFTKVESGKKNQRAQLSAAIDRANHEGAVLVIAKLDRLSRNASFIFTLRDSKVNCQCVDIPDASTLTIGIFATLAQHEHALISRRTKASLGAKKAHGTRLGKPENLTAAARAKGMASTVARARANENNRRALPVARMLQASGHNLGQIANHLNADGFKTARGYQF